MYNNEKVIAMKKPNENPEFGSMKDIEVSQATQHTIATEEAMLTEAEEKLLLEEKIIDALVNGKWNNNKTECWLENWKVFVRMDLYAANLNRKRSDKAISLLVNRCERTIFNKAISKAPKIAKKALRKIIQKRYDD